ncbi:MAG: trypsin-like peptidase domain-containing protein [Deltaproteobacteria bacterium]|nr:trypsin-like peptidase domain-containing protein [Deltaproteobacteria bacterium]
MGQRSKWEPRHWAWLGAVFVVGASVRVAFLRSEVGADSETPAPDEEFALEPKKDSVLTEKRPSRVEEAVPGAEDKIVRVIAAKGDAVGWIASAKGDVLTRILPTTQVGSSVAIEFSDGVRVDGQVKKISETLDMSVVACGECAAHGFLTTAKASLVRTGTVVYAFGSPAARSNLSRGKIVHPGRKVEDVVFTECDIPFGPSDSGGPLLDESGAAIGVLAANVSRLGGLCFALPIEYAAEGPGAVLASAPFSGSMQKLIETSSELAVRAPAADKEVILDMIRATPEFDRRSDQSTVTLSVEWSLEMPVSRPYSDSDKFSLVIASAGDGRTYVNGMGHVEPSRVHRDEATGKVSYRFAKSVQVEGRSLWRATVSIGLGSATSAEMHLGGF